MSEFQLARAGDDRALCALLRAHMPLVHTLCARFDLRSGHEDAFQQGCMGLVKAIRRFDEARGLRFSTYAVPVILGEIRLVLRKNETRVGWRARAALSRIRETQETLARDLGREPSVRELAEALSMRPEELLLLMERAQAPIVTDQQEAFAHLPDPTGAEWLERLLLWDIVSRLPGDEPRILRLRYQYDRSQGEIARLLGSTQSRVSRHEKLARERVRMEWLG